MKKYNTVIFDLDGTLLNTLEDLTDAVNTALTAHDYPARTIEEVRRFVGNGIGTLIRRAAPGDITQEAYDRVLSYFKEYYREHCNDKTKPYPGVTELLIRLKAEGCRLAIVSNKADFAVKELCGIYFGDTVSVAIGEREGIRRKPAPDTVEQALRELGASRENAVYVGDSDVDIETARNVGMPCISVTWGFRDEEFLRAHGGRNFAADVGEVEQQMTKELPV